MLSSNKRKKRNVITLICRLNSSREIYSPGFAFVNVLGKHTPKLSYKRKSTNPLVHVFVQFPFGGSGGIRTHVPLEAVTAFRVRAVMTTSIRFLKYYCAAFALIYVTTLLRKCQLFWQVAITPTFQSFL